MTRTSYAKLLKKIASGCPRRNPQPLMIRFERQMVRQLPFPTRLAKVNEKKTNVSSSIEQSERPVRPTWPTA